MSCPDCIKNKKSYIPSPLCGSGDCPEDVGCDDIVNTTCINVVTALDCVGTVSGATLDNVLQEIDAKVCEQTSNINACKVKTVSEDACCDYLGNKITSSLGIAKTFVSAQNCVTVNFALQEAVYTPLINYQNTWQSVIAPLQVAQASISLNNYVNLRGSVFYLLTTYPGTFQTVAQLPLTTMYPTTEKIFSFSYLRNASVTVTANIKITTTGLIQIFLSAPVTGIAVISLDGVNYHK